MNMCTSLSKEAVQLVVSFLFIVTHSANRKWLAWQSAAVSCADAYCLSIRMSHFR